jgi:protein-disulfide isomerase
MLIAAVMVSSAAVHREFFAPEGRASAKPVYVPGWKDWEKTGRLVGKDTAPIHVIEFMDFECPFCRKFNESIERVSAAHPGKIAISFVHFPLPFHSAAVDAARASECAATLARFGSMVSALFARQDSLRRLKDRNPSELVRLAKSAGIEDSLSFVRCMSAHDTVSKIVDGIELGKRVGVLGTPTVLINGWRFPGPPSDSALSAIVDGLLRGVQPAWSLRRMLERL